MTRRVERVDPPVAVNFDADPDSIVEQLRAVTYADGCAWCGDDVDEDGRCKRRCPASRRQERMD